MDKDLILTNEEIAEIDVVAKNIILYSEDDRRKADTLYKYYQSLIDGGDTQGETRKALAKSLELRESSVGNLIEILKLKTKLVEKKIALEMKGMESSPGEYGRGGSDTSDIISRIDGET